MKLLAIGDIVVIVGLIGVGLQHHAIDPIVFPIHTIRTSIPFVVGWVLAASLVGLYSGPTHRSIRSTLGRVSVAWITAAIVGALIRSTALFPGGMRADFVLVMVVTGLFLFLPWRATVALVQRGLNERRG